MRMFDEVAEEARNLSALKLVLTVLAVPFFVVGWLASKAVRALAFVAVWAWAAVKVGWRDARRRGER